MTIQTDLYARRLSTFVFSWLNMSCEIIVHASQINDTIVTIPYQYKCNKLTLKLSSVSSSYFTKKW